MRLTNDVVEALEYDGTQTASGGWKACYVWDETPSAPPGFGVRIYPSGHKTFFLKYRNQYNKQRYLKLGVFPQLSASAARKAAAVAYDKVREGRDPSEEENALRGTLTVRQLGAEWLAKHAKRNRKSWETDQSRLERHLYARFGKLAAPELNRTRVATMHREIAAGENTKTRKGKPSRGGEVEANRALQLVKTVWAWGIREGILPKGTENPAKGIRKFSETSRARWVRPHEMPWLLAALDEVADPFIGAAIAFILHTGARKREALDLKWADVDTGGKFATFRETKNDTDHTVPLSTPIFERLLELPRVEGNPYVFVGNVEGQSLTNIRKTWRRARKRAGELAAENEVAIDVTDVTIHDLRRTVGAWLATGGYSELLIGRVLNHTAQSVTGIYARLDDQTVRDALEAHARRLQAVREPDEGKVVELRGRG